MVVNFCLVGCLTVNNAANIFHFSAATTPTATSATTGKECPEMDERMRMFRLTWCVCVCVCARVFVCVCVCACACVCVCVC